MPSSSPSPAAARTADRPGGLIRRALRGDGPGPTEGPVVTAILLLAIPMVLEMVMESVFAVVDLFWVSRLGVEAVTAVGLTESLMALLYTVYGGLAIGVTALVARRVGEGDGEAASAAVGQAVLAGGVLAVGLGVAGAWTAPELLRLMGAEDTVVAVGSGYTRVLLGCNGVLLYLFVLNAAFRGAGDAAIAMRVLWLANGLNLVLDPLLIFGWGPFPELGVTGAAVATTLGRGTAVAVQLWTLWRWSDRLRLRAAHLWPRVDVLRRLARLSSNGAFQTFVATSCWIGLVRVMAEFGSEAVAGYTVAIRLLLFALLPAWGLSNAAATMVGQNLGAGNPERAEHAAWTAGWINLAFLGVVGVVFLVATPWLVAPFGLEGDAAVHAQRGLRIMSGGFFFYAHGMVLAQSFNGAGDTWTPTWLNVVCLWLLLIPLAWGLSHPAGWGPAGAFTAVPVAYAAMTLLAAAIFRRGRWKLRTV